jgi:hypothetical protein
MPSRAMQDWIDAFRDQQKAGARQLDAAAADTSRLPGRARPSDAAGVAGVDVTLRIAEGLPHVYPIMFGIAEAAEATEQIRQFPRERRNH